MTHLPELLSVPQAAFGRQTLRKLEQHACRKNRARVFVPRGGIMFDRRWLRRIGSIACAVGLAVIAVSASAAGQEADYPFAFGTLTRTQSGPAVQSGPGVIQTLLRLAFNEEYTFEQADALAEAVGLLIGDDVPPGTILQVSKDLLAELTPTDLLSALEELGQRIIDGEPPGQVANDLLGRGNGNGNGRDNHENNGNGNGPNGADEDVDDPGNNGNGNGNSGAAPGNNGNGNGNGNPGNGGS